MLVGVYQQKLYATNVAASISLLPSIVSQTPLVVEEILFYSYSKFKLEFSLWITNPYLHQSLNSLPSSVM